jgi:hypothetical protein
MERFAETSKPTPTENAGDGKLCAVNCGFTSQWSTFFAVQAGAAATLTGLVFVAVALNLETLLAYRAIVGRAAEALLELVLVFFAATVGLVPGQRTKFLAIEWIAIGAFFWVTLLAVHVQYLRNKKPAVATWLFVARAVLMFCATLPFCIAGIALLMGRCEGINWVVPGFVFSFAAAMVGSWVLLVEVRR